MRSLWLPALIVIATSKLAAAAGAGDQPIFEKDVAPILRTYCWKCHGGGGLAGGLDLRKPDLILKGGLHGPAVVVGQPGKSLLYQKIINAAMPPPKTGEENVVYAPTQPGAKEKAVIHEWISKGALSNGSPRPLSQAEDPPLSDEDRQWWAFVSPRRPSLPETKNGHKASSHLDRFLQRLLEQRNLSFAQPADPGTLLTRLYLDLTGLPPAPEEISSYLEDDLPNRYQRKVEQLLASPAFGHHWGQYWLDAAGYNDVTGSDNDGAIIKLHDGKSRYRDYVISAHNSNMPYDQFITEQLAGDEIADWKNAKTYSPDIVRQLIATGFLRQAADTSGEKELNTPDIRNRVLLDTVQTVSSALMGLTLQCARCHSHKFDPISQADYFRFTAIFVPALNPQNWKHPGSRHLWSEPPPERARIDQENARLRKSIVDYQNKIKQRHTIAQSRVIARRLTSVPPAVQEDVRKSRAVPEEKRTPLQKYLADKLGPLLDVSTAITTENLTEEERQDVTALGAEINVRERQLKQYFKIQALWEFAPPTPFYLFVRGQYDQPGPVVSPGLVRVLQSPGQPFTISAGQDHQATSGYRKSLAHWLTRVDHPLTARVYVNRVWQRYFGTGIVSTVDNFGLSGEEPTHPALLDWLATEFTRSGWNVKELHKMIVSSSAYRQSSQVANQAELAHAQSADPDNRLLWKMPLRRLESGAIRDRVLMASGKLDRRIGGAPVPLLPQPNGYVVIDKKKLVRPSDEFRRSVYILARRNYHLTQLNVFDQPVLAKNCTRRNSSAGVSQSLLMLNSRFMLEQSAYCAERLTTAPSGSADARLIKDAFNLILCRDPSSAELQFANRFLGTRKTESVAAGIAELCHVLFNTNEFLYIH